MMFTLQELLDKLKHVRFIKFQGWFTLLNLISSYVVATTISAPIWQYVSKYRLAKIIFMAITFTIYIMLNMTNACI